MLIRPATAKDAQAMLNIYIPYILETTASFEYDPPSIKEFSDRITTTLKNGLPWLVCEEDGHILGYAYAGRYGERVAYRWTAISSVYLRQDIRGGGVGTKLYKRVFKILTQCGYRSVHALITGENESSVGFHKKMGFTWSATMESMGYKEDKWLDIHYYRKELNPDSVALDGFPTEWNPADWQEYTF